MDEGDGFDEIANVSNRQTPDEAFEASGGQLPGRPIRKLADRRWTDHLDLNEERDVIRLAKADDPAAKKRLVHCFQKTIIDIAGQSKYGGPKFDDRLASGWCGFWKALRGFNLKSNNGFYAYAVKFIEGAVVDCVHDYHRHGGKLETLEDRKNRTNGSTWRPDYTEYNGVEGSHYDLEGREPTSEPISGWIGADDHEFRQWDESSGLAQLRLTRRLANIGRNLGVPRECIGVDENPWRNGGGHHRKSRFPIPRFEGRDDGGRLPLREYLKENPTPSRYKITAPVCGNAPA